MRKPPNDRRERDFSRIRVRARRATTVSRKLFEIASDRAVSGHASRTLGPSHSDRFEAVVHFAGDAASTYQLLQWLWPLEKLSERVSVVIVCRSARAAISIAEQTSIPVRFARWMSQLDALVGGDATRCVLYVNQATQNFQTLHYSRPAHVHLSHGESEKSSMVSNKLKAYDYVLTAGQSARERLMDQLIGFEDDRMIDVGRPQLDEPSVVPQEWKAFDHTSGSARPTVFWAPTWEGDSGAMAYGTLPDSGVLVAKRLLEEGARIIYRPHPRTGYVDQDFRNADAVIREMLSGDQAFIDTTSAIRWQFDVADACITEMSSIAYDWLSTGKPLALILPRWIDLRGTLADRVPSFDPLHADDAVEELLSTAAHGDGACPDVAEIAAFYLGDTSPGAQVERFTSAVQEIVHDRDEILARQC